MSARGTIMAKKKSKGRLPNKLQAWVDARKSFHLSHAHVQERPQMSRV